MIGWREAYARAVYWAIADFRAVPKRYVYGYIDSMSGRWAYTWTFERAIYDRGVATRELQ